MTATLTTPQWLDAVDTHYLHSYVQAGGSSVKFVVCFDGTHPARVIDELDRRAAAGGYVTVKVDAAATKVHFIEQLLAQVSDRVPWTELTDHVLAEFARANHWAVPDAVAPPRAAGDLPVPATGDSGPWAVLDRDTGALLAVYERHRGPTAKPAVVVAPR